MNGYELTDKLRKTRRRHRLSAATQALYHELVAICNEEGWPDEFKCSNDELFSVLQISEKSLVSYRLELIQAGLIFYMSGKSKKKVGVYSFKRDFLNGCKFYNQSDSLSGSQSVNQSDSQPDENLSDLNKTKTETEIFIVIGKVENSVSRLKELFDQDNGLKMRWQANGLPAEKFPHGVELWTQRHHKKTYHDFQKARDHFFNWIQYYNSEAEKHEKTNGITTGNGKKNGLGAKSGGFGILADALRGANKG